MWVGLGNEYPQRVRNLISILDQRKIRNHLRILTRPANPETVLGQTGYPMGLCRQLVLKWNYLCSLMKIY